MQTPPEATRSPKRPNKSRKTSSKSVQSRKSNKSGRKKAANTSTSRICENNTIGGDSGAAPFEASATTSGETATTPEDREGIEPSPESFMRPAAELAEQYSKFFPELSLSAPQRQQQQWPDASFRVPSAFCLPPLASSSEIFDAAPAVFVPAPIFGPTSVQKPLPNCNSNATSKSRVAQSRQNSVTSRATLAWSDLQVTAWKPSSLSVSAVLDASGGVVAAGASASGATASNSGFTRPSSLSSLKTFTAATATATAQANGCSTPTSSACEDGTLHSSAIKTRAVNMLQLASAWIANAPFQLPPHSHSSANSASSSASSSPQLSVTAAEPGASAASPTSTSCSERAQMPFVKAAYPDLVGHHPPAALYELLHQTKSLTLRRALSIYSTLHSINTNNRLFLNGSQSHYSKISCPSSPSF